MGMMLNDTKDNSTLPPGWSTLVFPDGEHAGRTLYIKGEHHTFEKPKPIPASDWMVDNMGSLFYEQGLTLNVAHEKIGQHLKKKGLNDAQINAARKNAEERIAKTVLKKAIFFGKKISEAPQEEGEIDPEAEYLLQHLLQHQDSVRAQAEKVFKAIRGCTAVEEAPAAKVVI